MTMTQSGLQTARAAAIGGERETIHSIGIAAIRVVKAPEKVRTVLGSCVGVAVYDRVAKVGGLAHVILPSSAEGTGDPGKFADTAVDLLVEQLVAGGADRKRLAAKLAGGAAMFGGAMTSGLGDRNVKAVKQRLAQHAVRVAGEAVGGGKGRKMLLDPASGDVRVEIIGEAPQII